MNSGASWKGLRQYRIATFDMLMPFNVVSICSQYSFFFFFGKYFQRLLWDTCN